MPGDAARIEGYERRIGELEALVATQAATIASQAAMIEAQSRVIERLEARVGELERELGQNSGNSGKPPSRDSAAERQRQAAEREKRKQSAGGEKRPKGKQRGAKGSGLKMSLVPDEIIDHRPPRCEDCGAALADDPDSDFTARQVIDLPEVTPVMTEHRAHAWARALMDGLDGAQTWCGWGILARNSIKTARLIETKTRGTDRARHARPTRWQQPTDFFPAGCVSPAALDSLDAPNGPQGPKRRADRTQKRRGAEAHGPTPPPQRRPGRRPSPIFSGASS